MVINTNVSALSSARLLAGSVANLSKSLARLSSGSNFVSAQDDVAGQAQTFKFEAQIHRNSAASANVGNAISFTQTQDGFLQKVQKALDRMSELSMLAQDVTKTDTDRSNYTTEFNQLQNYISDVGAKTFNGVTLFASSALGVTIDSDALTFSMPAIDLINATVTVGLAAIYNASSTAINNTTSAAGALANLKTAIQTLANLRASVGANIQRLTLTTEQLAILNENLSAATSWIKDVDVAEESTSFARYNILVQSGTAMLTQANLLPQSALRLLG